MATAQSTNHLTSRLKIDQYDFDPGATTETEIAWVDLADYDSFLAIFFRTIGTGATTFTIVANSESDGSGTDVEIKAHAVASEPDAVGDTIVLECNAEEVGAASTTASGALRYVTAVVSVATGTDEGVVTYVRGDARHRTDGLTADNITA